MKVVFLLLIFMQSLLGVDDFDYSIKNDSSLEKIKGLKIEIETKVEQFSVFLTNISKSPISISKSAASWEVELKSESDLNKFSMGNAVSVSVKDLDHVILMPGKRIQIYTEGPKDEKYDLLMYKGVFGGLGLDGKKYIKINVSFSLPIKK